jgi:heme exporter protein D
MPLYEPFKCYKCVMISINNILLEIIETTLSKKEILHDEEKSKQRCFIWEK